MNKKILLLLFSSLIIGCSSSPNNNPSQYFSLPHIQTIPPVNKVHYPFVKVDLPNFSSKHNTEAIFYTGQKYELARYSQSEWKEPLPTLLQEWLLQSLEHSNLFAGVMRATSRAKVPLFLESDIIKFQHNIKVHEVEVSIRLTLLDYNTRKILKHKIFHYQKTVSEVSAKGAVHSFNQILKQLEADIVAWLAVDIMGKKIR